MEYRFFTGDMPDVATFEFHKDRERVPHLEQPIHRPRLERAVEFIKMVATSSGRRTVSDLGCGDGGLLSLLKADPDIQFDAWGYDFQPSNAAGWKARGVRAFAVDVFNDPSPMVDLGDICVMTEVLEHLADPHAVLRWVAGKSHYLVASSPWDETPESHDGCHAWGWDKAGYHELFRLNGWERRACAIVGPFHVVLSQSMVRR